MNVYRADKNLSWFNEKTKAMKLAEDAGLKMPDWFLSLAAGILIANNEYGCSVRSTLLLVVGFRELYGELSEEVRNGIEAHEVKMSYAVPDSLPAGFGEDGEQANANAS
ncbi:MAG TPA: hypothetical protein VGR38_01240 [Candidatus Polarisedimenticolia bacterium]|nr:hypothetical protein [Candidatus Polarisedimenticolia bacterium]